MVDWTDVMVKRGFIPITDEIKAEVREATVWGKNKVGHMLGYTGATNRQVSKILEGVTQYIRPERLERLRQELRKLEGRELPSDSIAEKMDGMNLAKAMINYQEEQKRGGHLLARRRRI